MSGEVVIVYAYYDTKGHFLQSLALPGAGQNPCQRRKLIVSTNNGVMNERVHNLLMQFFTLGYSKVQVFEVHFFCTVQAM